MDLMLQTVEAIRERKERDEDLQQRRYVNQRHLIDDARRLVDKKSEILKNIAEIAALIGGFAMVVLVETFIDQKTHSQFLLLCFGMFTSLVVGLMFICLITTTLMLVTVLDFDTTRSVLDNSLPFDVFWKTRCEADFQFSFSAFKLAIPSFLISLICLSWIKFDHSLGAAVAITVISGSILLLWFFKALPQWGSSGSDQKKDLYGSSDRRSSMSNVHTAE